MSDPNPEELTSPGTVDDPALEEQRAREAAERERESRMTNETKFEEQRRELEEEEAHEARRLGDVPPPREE